MSRSYRKRPFCGLTTCESEKLDKQIANRSWRSMVRQHCKNIISGMIDADDFVFPVKNEVSCIWDFGKDGKQRLRIDIDVPEWLQEIRKKCLRK